MLNSYQAEINGSQLIWIDQPPKPVQHRSVLVVMEEVAAALVKNPPTNSAYSAFMQAQGCLGKASRDQIDAQLAAMRSEWDDRPLGA
ncbi:MAG: hypothetical protein WBK51_02680 [Polaromonas sp.]